MSDKVSESKSGDHSFGDQSSEEHRPVQLHRGSANSAPYPVSRLAPGFDLVDLAREIEQADSMTNHTAHAKLKVIAETMLRLKDEARKVLEETRHNQRLHRAQCQFKKIPGKIYHLYRKPDGDLYFSMLAPHEWGGQPAHEFQGSYRLEADQSWKAVDDLQTHGQTHDQARNDIASIEHLLDSL